MDAQQQQVVELRSPSALVLAGPGCGKTYILAKRVFEALAIQHIPTSKMLCLTFTNRAAREMNQRIESHIGAIPEGLFVGNLHRFCLRFLFVNRIVSPDTSVVSDEDLYQFAEETFGEAVDIEKLQRVAAHNYQVSHKHPYEVQFRLGAEPDDSMELDARLYTQFKDKHHLIDFDDILLLTYTALINTKPENLIMTGYKWIQVDEVQDLTPLQLAIIDLIKADDASVLYLGDEQQAIFGFAGATPRVLDSVRRRCQGNIYHLERNYRSPRELVDFCNEYAEEFLNIPSEMLPTSVNGPGGQSTLSYFHLPANYRLQFTGALVCNKLEHNKKDSIAVLVRTNREVDIVSEYLNELDINHIALSKNDLFHSIDFRTLWCHLAVVQRPERREEWARLLYQFEATKTLSSARNLIAQMSGVGICPDSLLCIEQQTDIEYLCSTFSNTEQEIVVFDTETTGLDVNNDDIVQIAAIKMRGGEIVPDSELNIFIHTYKTIPTKLGDTQNPLLEAYNSAEHLDASVALKMFVDYIGNATLAGHNLDFDLAILHHNNARRASDCQFEWERTIDTLRICRLMFPQLWDHSLGHMISYLAVDGNNSHLAQDDVFATANLIQALYQQAIELVPRHNAFRSNPKIIRTAHKLTAKYGGMYKTDRHEAVMCSDPKAPTLAEIMKRAHNALVERNAINGIPHFDYILDLVNKLIINPTNEPRLRQQLEHINELQGFNEGDLFAQGIIDERVLVLTIHKAKGMEMDDVIIPNISFNHNTSETESLRVFYVAISRARKRLTLGFSKDPYSLLGNLAERLQKLSINDI